jgi:hypothetical protein
METACMAVKTSGVMKQIRAYGRGIAACMMFLWYCRREWRARVVWRGNSGDRT